jgi:hypothetical protein
VVLGAVVVVGTVGRGASVATAATATLLVVDRAGTSAARPTVNTDAM